MEDWLHRTTEYFRQGGAVMWFLGLSLLLLWYALGYRLLTLRRGRPITPERVDEALAGLGAADASTDADLVAPLLVAFLRGGVQPVATVAGF